VDVNLSSPRPTGCRCSRWSIRDDTRVRRTNGWALFDTNDDGLVTVGELRAASGLDAVAGLYGTGDGGLQVVIRS